jgi:chlorophyll synthase
VQLGAERAAWVASAVMLIPQLIVIALLASWGRIGHALAIDALVLAQVVMMHHFVKRPVERALWMSGFGVPLEVAGMMVSAFALRGVLT